MKHKKTAKAAAAVPTPPAAPTPAPPSAAAQPDPRPQLQAAREATPRPVVTPLPVAKLARKLDANALKDAALVRNVWHATVAEGTTQDELLNPPFWTHSARKLRPGDRIEVTEAAGAYFAELYVHQSDKLSARVELLRMHQFHGAPSAEDIESDSAYAVQWAGATAMWRVLRKADKAVVRDKFGTRQEALVWADDYETRFRSTQRA